ncbi:hypothetical protein CRUP_030705, partial [Coryphaenoides rupestris]
MEDSRSDSRQGCCQTTCQELELEVVQQVEAVVDEQQQQVEYPQLSTRHEEANRLLEKARRKELVSNVWLGGLQQATSPQYGALSDSSSSDSGSAPPHRRPGHSPTRVRFEDETEREAEHRYMERVALRPMSGDRGQGDAQGTASFAADRTLELPTNPYPTSTPAPPPQAALPQSYWPSPPARPPRGVGLSGRSLSCPGGGESDSLKIAEGARAAVDGQAGGPMRGEQQKDNSYSPAQGVGLDCQGAELNCDGVEPSDQRGRPRLSLRQLFSGLRGPGARLRGRRSCSLDHLTSQTLTPQPPTALIQTPQTTPRPSPLPRTSSLQSFSLGAPLAQLRKSSSIQSLTSGQKKSDRSAAYSPASPAPWPLQRALSVEDVGAPSGMRWVGRVSQAFPDGSLMLELQRPPAGPYGFLVSRGRGRRDSGVYVEEMDSSVEKLYAGLLGAGDEILE